MHQNHWIWISMLVVLLAAHSVHGLVWSLVLGNPVIDMKDESSGLADPGADDLAESLEDSDDVQHPRNTRLKLQSGSRPTRHHQHSQQVNIDKVIFQEVASFDVLCIIYKGEMSGGSTMWKRTLL